MSQLSIYSSSQGGAGNPGPIYGTASDLIRVLDLILVNGWTGVSPAGWSKPFSNSGNLGCYQVGGGSNCCLAINDNGPNVTSTYREARITGYTSMASVSTGSNQYPNAAASQGVTPFGFVPVRKSADLVTARSWIAFADALTCYFFVLTTDVAGVYMDWAFGDIYSLGGSGDAYRSIIIGRAAENSGTSANSRLDLSSSVVSSVVGYYMPRTVGGGGTAIACSIHGDMAKAQTTGATVVVGGTASVQAPNSADNSYWVSPIWVSETVGGIIRGRLRGLWQLCHIQSSFSDGQTFTGSNDTAGKTFQVVLKTGGGGCLAVETSNTLETN